MFLEKVLSHFSAKHGQFLELALAPATLLRRLIADSFFTRGLQNENFNSFAPALAFALSSPSRRRPSRERALEKTADGAVFWR